MKNQILAGCLLLFAPQLTQAASIVNGGFENLGGSLASWTATNSGDSAWYVQSGASSPFNGFTVPQPPQGTYAAMEDGGAPGAAALAQSFTVPVNAIDVLLSFDYYVLNPNSASGTYTIPSPDSLDFLGDPVQQARVDLLTSSASPFDITPLAQGGGLVANIFQTQPGDSNGTEDTPQYTALVTDIMADVTPGVAYQLRFAEADNLGQLIFGIDNVRVAFVVREGGSPTPEPSTLLLATVGLLAAAAFRRTCRHL